jgi:hypothetical protein
MAKEPFPTRPASDQIFPELSLGSYLPPARERPVIHKPSPPVPSALTAFASALDRLEETIDQETATLAEHRPADLHDFNRRKSHSLLELTRITRTLPPNTGGDLRIRLEALRDKLVRNQAVLTMHLSAVKEIADLILGAMTEADSDGTYGAVPNSWEVGR